MTRRNRKWTLHNYWDDDVTIECRYFSTKKDAEIFAKSNGYKNYIID